METKKRFSCIDEELFADVCGTVKAQESKKADRQLAFAVINAEVMSLDSALKKDGEHYLAAVIRAVERHAGNRSCVSDISMLSLLKDQVSECTGKRFCNLSILSKEDVVAAVCNYLCDVEERYLMSVITTVHSIYSNGFIVSAE